MPTARITNAAIFNLVTNMALNPSFRKDDGLTGQYAADRFTLIRAWRGRDFSIFFSSRLTCASSRRLRRSTEYTDWSVRGAQAVDSWIAGDDPHDGGINTTYLAGGSKRRISDWLGIGCRGEKKERKPDEPFRYGLNTATLMGQKLSIVEEVEIASRAGYQAIEPWVRELDQYVKGGGSLKDLGKRIADRGLRVESAIDFPEWIVNDDAKREKGLENARRGMDRVKQIGGTRIAAPPAGATQRADIPLLTIAQRYRALLDIGAQIGVVPQIEVWGFSKTLTRLSEAVFVAI